MFAHIVGVSVGIRVVESRIRIRGHILLVSRPADVFLLEQVHNGGYISGNGLHIVSSQTPEVATNRSQVVWLTWVGYAVVPMQGNALGREIGKDCLRCCLCIVRVLQPNLNEAVEHLSSDSGRCGKGTV